MSHIQDIRSPENCILQLDDSSDSFGGSVPLSSLSYLSSLPLRGPNVVLLPSSLSLSGKLSELRIKHPCPPRYPSSLTQITHRDVNKPEYVTRYRVPSLLYVLQEHGGDTRARLSWSIQLFMIDFHCSKEHHCTVDESCSSEG